MTLAPIGVQTPRRNTDASHKAVVMEKLLDSAPLFLTGNTDTVYCTAMLDLKRDGATVVNTD